jgi:hypothetical protein
VKKKRLGALALKIHAPCVDCSILLCCLVPLLLVMNRVTEEKLQLRIYGDDSLPTLIYLPGMHGDWTLVGGLRKHVLGKVRFVEMTYPRTLTWSMDDYANEIASALAEKGITHGWLLGDRWQKAVSGGRRDPCRRLRETSPALGRTIPREIVRACLLADHHHHHLCRLKDRQIPLSPLA